MIIQIIVVSLIKRNAQVMEEKKKTLTPEELSLLDEVRDEWIGKFRSNKTRLKLNKEAASAGIDWLYETAGAEKPVKLFVNSPWAAQILANHLQSGVRKFDESKLDEWIAEAMKNPPKDMKFYDFGHCSVSDYGWVAFYDYFTKIGEMNHEVFNRFKALLNSGIYDTIQFKGVCIICEMPKTITETEETLTSKWEDGWETTIDITPKKNKPQEE